MGTRGLSFVSSFSSFGGVHRFPERFAAEAGQMALPRPRRWPCLGGLTGFASELRAR